MKNLLKACSIIIIPLFIISCAGTKITTIEKIGRKNNIVKGFVTYQAELYLWIMADSSGKNLTYKYISLPNKNVKIVIQPKRGFGSEETSFKITDGWMLSEYGSKSDSKVPETITGVAGLATAAVGFIPMNKDVKNLIEKIVPGLYKINYDNDGKIVGFIPIANYPLPVPGEPKIQCGGCACEYEGKKYSENAVLEMPGDKNDVKIKKLCANGLWIDK